LSDVAADEPTSRGRDPKYLLVTCYVVGGLVGVVVLGLLVALAAGGHPLPLVAAAVGALLPFPLRGIAYLLGVPRPVKGRRVTAYPTAPAEGEERSRQALGGEMTKGNAPGQTRLGPRQSSSDRSLRDTSTERRIIINLTETEGDPSARSYIHPEEIKVHVATGRRFELHAAMSSSSRPSKAVTVLMLTLSGCAAVGVLIAIGVPNWGAILGLFTPTFMYLAIRLFPRRSSRVRQPYIEDERPPERPQDNT
jgi:hypothetical protein